MESNKQGRNLKEEDRVKRLPFRNGKLPFMGKKVTNEDNETGKLKEPIVMIIKDNYDMEIWQNVKPGKIRIERGEEKVDIMLPKSKILGIPWGGENIRGWVVSVAEAVALPTDVTHDSLEIKRAVDAMQTNYKNYHAQEIRSTWEGRAKLLFYIALGVGALMFIAGMFGMNVVEMIGLEKVVEVKQAAETIPPAIIPLLT